MLSKESWVRRDLNICGPVVYRAADKKDFALFEQAVHCIRSKQSVS